MVNGYNDDEEKHQLPHIAYGGLFGLLIKAF